jgi:PPOX class probable F420-dependent enzyme
VSQPSPSRELHGDAIVAHPLVRELLAARLVGVLSTLEPDGSVHAVPMWLSGEGGEIVLATGSDSRKVRNLERDDRATLTLHDSRPGCEVCGVSLRGRVGIVRQPEAARLVERVHRRYVTPTGLDLSEVRSFLGHDDVALRFYPEAAITWDERESVASRVLRASGEALPLESTTPRV